MFLTNLNYIFGMYEIDFIFQNVFTLVKTVYVRIYNLGFNSRKSVHVININLLNFPLMDLICHVHMSVYQYM